ERRFARQRDALADVLHPDDLRLRQERLDFGSLDDLPLTDVRRLADDAGRRQRPGADHRHEPEPQAFHVPSPRRMLPRAPDSARSAQAAQARDVQRRPEPPAGGSSTRYDAPLFATSTSFDLPRGMLSVRHSPPA